jgi:hypothetical protein
MRGSPLKSKDFAQLAKQLLPDFPGFAVLGPLMYMRPIGHTLRGFCFESHSYEAKLFYVWVFFLPLFVPTKHIGFSLGNRIAGRDGERWSADAPNVVSDLRFALQRDGLPFLRGLGSAREVAYAAEGLGRSQSLHVQQAIAYALAYVGAREEAGKALDRVISMVDDAVPWQRDIGNRAVDLKVKASTNPVEAMRQLDAWKAESLRDLKLKES